MPLKQLFSRKPISANASEVGYARKLSAFDLTCLGVGAIVGAGIFVLTGTAARNFAGPGIIISFIIAGFISALSSLCYAEMGSVLPYSGSAYSFTYATLGEFMAWIIGWDLMLEYLVGAATVAVGWSGYLTYLAQDITGNDHVWDARLVNAPFVWIEPGNVLPWDPKTVSQGAFFYNYVECPSDPIQYCQAIINIPALFIVLFCTGILVFGIRESITVNNLLVAFKMLTILVFIGFGLFHINPVNYEPFVPANTGVRGQYGFSGVTEATVSVFFAYIGFDAVTTAAYEAKNPQRDMPIGIIGSLTICTILYIGVSAILTGMVKYTEIDINAPVAAAVRRYAPAALSVFIEVGAIAGLTSVLLALMLGQPRIFQAMSQDGLFPAVFGRINKKTKTPVTATLTTGVACALLAAILPVDILGNLTSVGTLFAFFLVSLSTAVLRYLEPDLPRQFQIPGGKWIGGYAIPLFSAALSLWLFFQSSWASILRVLGWMVIGLVIYFSYGFRNSVLRHGYGGDDVEKERPTQGESTATIAVLS